ncbi:MAG: class I SAM-dependent methyltransferase [Chloroflexi bacterium]|nr:class I SAM-dependent methyltransferase [Chloroflexota bacterium]
MPCECCKITNDQFGKDTAEADLKEYRRKGPAKQTRLILEAVRSLNLKDASLLDVGGGIGAIYHELMKDMVSHATHVDASSAYLTAAKQETERRGNAEKVNFIHADFTDVAETIPQADVVTLDRVVCCYPDYKSLLKAAASRSSRALVMAYPRENGLSRFVITVMDWFLKISRNPFRVFVHPVAEMNALLRAEGLQRKSLSRLFVWEVALYQRS